MQLSVCLGYLNLWQTTEEGRVLWKKLVLVRRVHYGLTPDPHVLLLEFDAAACVSRVSDGLESRDAETVAMLYVSELEKLHSFSSSCSTVTSRGSLLSVCSLLFAKRSQRAV